MHLESPTDATVTTHPSIMTNVTVVPEECAEKQPEQKLDESHIQDNRLDIKKAESANMQFEI